MTTPPLLLGAALLFWGWHTGFFVGAIIIAAVLEGSRLVRWRWVASDRDELRIRRLCAVVLTVMMAYCLATIELLRAFLITLSLYPLAVLPVMFAHAYGSAGTMGTGMLFFLSGKRAADASDRPLLGLPPCYPYLAILILSASAANVRAPWFYAGCCLLSAWALWAARPSRSSPLLWAGVLLSAIVLGYLGQLGLYTLQKQIETALVGWMGDFTSGGDADPARSHTAIGRIGTLKLSDAIVLRVQLPDGEPTPLLLHEASYRRYASTIWSAGDPDFQAVQPEPDGTTWILAEAAPPRQLTVLASLRAGQGILALPAGTTRIAALPVGTMQRSRLGTVRVQEGPALVAYQSFFDPGSAPAAPPDATDVSVPQREIPVLARIVDELRLTAQPPRQALQSLAEFFQTRFRYALYQQDRPPGTSPLQDFLLHSRSGHCEYFATATVLLLRQAGIPARYATGYLVHEFSRLENRYVVRARHAHAWVHAYVDGAWRSLDTTPTSWTTIEADASSWWAPVSDLWSWGIFHASWWWLWARQASRLSHALWLLIPLGAFLAWRWLASGRSILLVRENRQAQQARPWPGADSEFYALESRLEARGLGRHPWEPTGRWLRRIETHESLPVNRDALRAILSLHGRYRFDPEGISPAERQSLHAEVRALLAQLAAHAPNAHPVH